jgi:uncharacterized repeat protein (TIGR01451 family)
VKEKDMFQGKTFIALAAIVACSFGSQAFAVEGCIELQSVAEIEKEVVDAQGVKRTQLVPADKVVPGVEVTWTVTATNVCQKPSEAITINNPVPQHMTYVANSATGPGADITFSVDGKTFAGAGKLTVQENGAARVVRGDEFRHIRWTFRDALQPGARATARFRTVLN